MSEPEKKSRTGLFSKKKVHDETNEKSSTKGHDDPAEHDFQATVVEEEPLPASFTSLFRFTTPFEFFLDFVGIVAAAGAGAAQVRLAVNPCQDWSLISNTSL